MKRRRAAGRTVGGLRRRENLDVVHPGASLSPLSLVHCAGPTVAYGGRVGKGMTCAVHHRPAWRLVAAAALLLPVLAGCTEEGGRDDAASQLLFSPSPSPEQTPDPTPAAPAAPTLPDFPESCGDLVPTSEVVAIVGRPLPGDTTFVFAEALPEIGRTARVTCGYGVGAGRGPDPAVEITVNEYEDEAAAQERIDVTLEAAAEAGDEVSELATGPYRGWVLRDEDGASYVVDAGSRTLVISLQRRLVPARAETVVLTQLAERALALPTATTEPAA
jgi:hypothetical protein